MKQLSSIPRVSLGIYPTPFYKLENLSRREGKNIWIKRDDLCGVALGGNKVRKLEFLLAQARADGCDYVFTTGGAQSNHAMLTAACAARLGMKCVLVLQERGVTDRAGNLILDELYGAEVRFVDSDSYDDVYGEMRRIADGLEAQGHKCALYPVGGSTALGSLGYVDCVREIAVQALAAGIRVGHIVSATGSGGTTAGLVLGAKLFMPGTAVLGVGVADGGFADIVPPLANEAAALLDAGVQVTARDFELYYSYGDGYAIPNPQDTPRILEMAREEGILLDPIYTGKAFSAMLDKLHEGYFDEEEHIVFLHSGGTAALFAVPLA